eukprot:1188624-Prorocentrum_minimum.AAC.3
MTVGCEQIRRVRGRVSLDVRKGLADLFEPRALYVQDIVNAVFPPTVLEPHVRSQLPKYVIGRTTKTLNWKQSFSKIPFTGAHTRTPMHTYRTKSVTEADARQCVHRLFVKVGASLSTGTRVEIRRDTKLGLESLVINTLTIILI